MRTLAIANQKGGVGKTTTAVHLGAALREAGLSVLLLDWDPQASLTVALRLDPEGLPETVYDVVQAVIHEEPRPTLGDVIVETAAGMPLVPASLALSAAELDLMHALRGEYVLADALAPVRDRYDVLLIDCPPSLGLLAINALCAADRVLIPVSAEYLPIRALSMLLRVIRKVQTRLHPGLSILGIVLTMVEPHLLHTREAVSTLREVLGDHIRIFDTTIKKTVRVREAAVAGESLLTYAPDHEVAGAYRRLAKEVMERW